MLRLNTSLVNVNLRTSANHENGWSAIAESGFLSHLQRIFIQTPTEHDAERTLELDSYSPTMRSLRSLAEADDRVALVQRNLSSKSSLVKAEASWEDSAAGIPWW